MFTNNILFICVTLSAIWYRVLGVDVFFLFIERLRVLQKHSNRLLCHVGKYIHCAPLAYNLGLLSLDDLHSLARLTFKVANNLTPGVLSNMLVRPDSIHSHSTRAHSSRFFVLQSSHFARVKFSVYQGATFLNNLPLHISNLHLLSKFKKSVPEYFSVTYVL